MSDIPFTQYFRVTEDEARGEGVVETAGRPVARVETRQGHVAL